MKKRKENKYKTKQLQENYFPHYGRQSYKNMMLTITTTTAASRGTIKQIIIIAPMQTEV